jgi:sulfide dehydrogenase [flavocytochrome c] flavoprotein chain
VSAPDRRRFLRGGGAALAMAAGIPRAALAQAKPKLLVVGAGPGGATAAKYVARDSGGAVEVTLIEPSHRYTACVHSNLYLGGLTGWDTITWSHDALASKYGVRRVHQAAQAIDRDRRSVRLADGSQLAYDRLVLAPGIDLKFDAVPGYSEAVSEAMPHAWKGASQIALLKRRLDAVADGDVIVIIPPPNPSRCPPAPYERASMMAHVLKAKGHRSSRIVILDPKASFPLQPLFQEGWEQHYPGMIEWQDPNMHGGIKGVDAATMTVATDLASYRAALVNVIPPQIAGSIARDAGLADRSGFCPIDAASMKSAQDPNIYVLGDACISGDMPKSAFSANNQAKVAALMIRGELTNTATSGARYATTCWSMIETDDAVTVGGRYEPKDGRIAAVDTFTSHANEGRERRRQNQADKMGWYGDFVADVLA